MTMRAIQIIAHGGPEVMAVRDVPAPVAGDGERLVTVSAAGINLADTMVVANTYPPRPTPLPFVPGEEVVGVDAQGRRVVGMTMAGYAEQAVVSERACVAVPDGVGDGDALAMLVQGITAWHVLRDCGRLAEGESVLIHAGAGGVGSIAIQLARLFGAGRIVAAASTPERRELVLGLGADAAVDSTDPGLFDAMREANGGEPYDVVLEMVGGETFLSSLHQLAPFGRLVTYGAASGVEPPAIAPGPELTRFCRAVVGFNARFAMQRGDFNRTVPKLLDLVQRGDVRTLPGAGYALADAPQAHRDLLARRITGKSYLEL
jgi:NADPH:quinone reductase